MVIRSNMVSASFLQLGKFCDFCLLSCIPGPSEKGFSLKGKNFLPQAKQF